ncbi:MAG: hypothetical protein R3Y47_00365 [Lachnospiraceae bacterium]
MRFHKEEIVGLGNNCEISFRIEDYFGGIEAQLFSWTLIKNQERWLESFDFDFDLLESGMELADNHMFSTKKYNILFHPRYDICEKSIEDAKIELTSRIQYLIQKTNRLLKSDQNLLFIIKIIEENPDQNKLFITNLYKKLMEVHPNMLLVVVMKKGSLTDQIHALEQGNLKIRSLKEFAPQKHTNILGDVVGWKAIFDEFCIKESNRYYYNLYSRRASKVYNAMKKRILGGRAR